MALEKSPRTPTKNLRSRVAFLALLGAASIHDKKDIVTPSTIAETKTVPVQPEAMSAIERQRIAILAEARTERLANRPWLGKLRIKMWFLQQQAANTPQPDEAEILAQYQLHLTQVSRTLGQHPTPEQMNRALNRLFGHFPYLRAGELSNIVTLTRDHTASCKGINEEFSALLVDSGVSGVGMRIYPGDPQNFLIYGHEATTVRYLEHTTIGEYDIADGGLVSAYDEHNSVYVREDEILDLYQQPGTFEPRYPNPPADYRARRRPSPIQATSILAPSLVRNVRSVESVNSANDTTHQPTPAENNTETQVRRYHRFGAQPLFTLLNQYYFRRTISMDSNFQEPHPRTPALSPEALRALSSAIEEIENHLYLEQEFMRTRNHGRTDIGTYQHRQICSLLTLGYEMAAQSFEASGHEAAAISTRNYSEHYRQLLGQDTIYGHETVTGTFNARIMYELSPVTQAMALARIENYLAIVDNDDRIIVEDVYGRRESQHLFTITVAESLVALLQTANDASVRARIVDVMHRWSEKNVIMKHLLINIMLHNDIYRSDENLIGEDPLLATARAYREVHREVLALATGARGHGFTLGNYNTNYLGSLETALLQIAAAASPSARSILTRDFMIAAFLFEALHYVEVTNVAEQHERDGTRKFNPPPSIWIRHTNDQRYGLLQIQAALRAQSFFAPPERYRLDTCLDFYLHYQDALPIRSN